MGRPNVGKSTLINSLIGQKIAAVSPRPQTTRRRQMGVLTMQEPPAQIVFIDTPGLHQPRYKLGELMNQEAIDTLDQSDEIMLVVDGSQPPQDEDHLLLELLNHMQRFLPILLVINKIDHASQAELEKNSDAFKTALPQATIVPISATRGDGLAELTQVLLERLPVGSPYFPEDQLTDLYERDIAADLIREAALTLLREEVPHGIAIRIDQFIERGENGAYIEATLFVERESHKPIVIGQGGRMLKTIGTAARKQIEAMSKRKVFLQLKVKVRPNWRNDSAVLRRFGYR